MSGHTLKYRGSVISIIRPISPRFSIMLPVWSRFGEPKDAEVRVVVWNVFVQFEPVTHHEGVADCDLPSLRHLEVLVLGK